MPKRVYLTKALAKNSKMHTAYSGEGAVHEDGKPGPLYKLEFFGGVAQNVPEALYQRFKDLGVATDKRPSRDEDEE